MRKEQIGPANELKNAIESLGLLNLIPIERPANMGTLPARVDRAASVISLLKQAGFQIKTPAEITAAMSLSSSAHSIAEVLATATQVDALVAPYKVNLAQRLHLVTHLILIERAHPKSSDKFSELVSEVSSQDLGHKASNPAYKHVYVAAQLCEFPGSVEARADSFKQRLAQLKNIGFSLKEGLTWHLAARGRCYQEFNCA